MSGSTPIVSTAAGRTQRRAAVTAVLLLGLFLAAMPAPAASAPGTADVALQVSFDPAAEVRLRGQRFAGKGADAANDVLARTPGLRVQRVFRASEAALDAQRARLQRAGRRNVPDLNRHYRILAVDVAQRDRVVRALDELAVVEDALAEPRPTPPPATPSFALEQRYAAGGPAGMNAAALAQLPGGRGELTKIVDVEYSWNTAHEDLGKAAAPAALIKNGNTPRDPFNNTDHGTAVIGTLIGSDNGFGVTGLAPNSELGLVNAVESSPCNCWALPQAIYTAADNMTPGDVMLVEQQVQGAASNNDYVAAEYWPAVYDAIAFATQSGIIVVEAAGNGGVNLDGPAYAPAFPRGRPDSGAILAGSGSGDCASSVNARMPQSTYGSRVNLQGWGQCVTTTGFGDLWNDGPNARYTSFFGGTSSAAALVAGAAALYSSVHQAVNGAAPTPQLLRSRLIATGTPQATGTAGHIGPLPNLAAAAADFDTTAPTVTITSGPAGATTERAPTFTFTASEAGVTFSCRLDEDPAFTPCSSPMTLAPQALGPHTFRVRATDSKGNTGAAATRAFTVEAVAPPPPPPPGPVPPPGDSSPPPLDTPFTGSGETIVQPPPAPAQPPSIGPGSRMTARVSAGGAVRLTRPAITCPSNGRPCTVSVIVRRTGPRGATIGRSAITVQPGRTARIRFTLSRAARTLLRRNGRLKAVVKITARHGGLTRSRTLQLTLKRR